MKYGERLDAALRVKGLKQKQLAALTGVKVGSISKIVRGDQDRSSFDGKFAVVLDVHAKWLSDGDEDYAPAWLSEYMANKNQAKPKEKTDNSLHKIGAYIGIKNINMPVDSAALKQILLTPFNMLTEREKGVRVGKEFIKAYFGASDDQAWLIDWVLLTEAPSKDVRLTALKKIVSRAEELIMKEGNGENEPIKSNTTA
jgi:transcriptional regulator with XRE-family HTH domain